MRFLARLGWLAAGESLPRQAAPLQRSRPKAICLASEKGDDMALPVREQVKYWCIALLVLFALLYVLGSVILPFLVGGAMAYFLDPVADRLQ